jgi:hypothetical protein
VGGGGGRPGGGGTCAGLPHGHEAGASSSSTSTSSPHLNPFRAPQPDRGQDRQQDRQPARQQGRQQGRRQGSRTEAHHLLVQHCVPQRQALHHEFEVVHAGHALNLLRQLLAAGRKAHGGPSRQEGAGRRSNTSVPKIAAKSSLMQGASRQASERRFGPEASCKLHIAARMPAPGAARPPVPQQRCLVPLKLAPGHPKPLQPPHLLDSHLHGSGRQRGQGKAATTHV